MHREVPTLCIGGCFQRIQTCPAQGVLRVVLVLRPCQHHLCRTHIGAHVVHMLVGLIVVDAPGQPDDLLCAEIVFQLLLDLGPAQLRVAATAQQTGFGGKDGALTVRVDGAALQHKVLCIIAVHAQCCADGAGGCVVLFPVGVKAVHHAAPCVELPVHAPHGAVIVHHAGGPHIPRPSVIGLDGQHMDVLVPGKLRLHGTGICRAGQHPHCLALGNGAGCLRKGRLGVPAAVQPGTGPHRPDHHTAAVRLIFRRHPEALGGGQGRKSMHCILLLFFV